MSQEPGQLPLAPDLNQGQGFNAEDSALQHIGENQDQEDGDHAMEEAAPVPAAAGKTPNVKAEKLDLKKHAGKIAEWLLSVSIALTLSGYERASWGLHLFTLLPTEVLTLVMASLNLAVDSFPDPAICTWQAVSAAIKQVCCAADDTDQGRMYVLLRYKAAEPITGRLKKILEDMEQMFLKMREPLGIHMRIFFICLKIPIEHRARFQFNGGRPWTSFEEFKTNYMAQHTIVEQDMARTATHSNKNKHDKNATKSTPKSGFTGNGPKRARFSPRGAAPPSSSSGNGFTPRFPVHCDLCGSDKHRANWKDHSGAYKCPKKAAPEASKGNNKPQKA